MSGWLSVNEKAKIKYIHQTEIKDTQNRVHKTQTPKENKTRGGERAGACHARCEHFNISRVISAYLESRKHYGMLVR